MMDIVERLRKWEKHEVVGGDCSEAADEIERLRAHIAEIEAWRNEGVALFDKYGVGLGAMFSLGKWWADRPWR